MCLSVLACRRGCLASQLVAASTAAGESSDHPSAYSIRHRPSVVPPEPERTPPALPALGFQNSGPIVYHCRQPCQNAIKDKGSKDCNLNPAPAQDPNDRPKEEILATSLDGFDRLPLDVDTDAPPIANDQTSSAVHREIYSHTLAPPAASITGQPVFTSLTHQQALLGPVPFLCQDSSNGQISSADALGDLPHKPLSRKDDKFGSITSISNKTTSGSTTSGSTQIISGAEAVVVHLSRVPSPEVNAVVVTSTTPTAKSHPEVALWRVTAKNNAESKTHVDIAVPEAKDEGDNEVLDV
ncbi:hypothetical protein BROUX41_001039 [Berkeleyomyces rouxiae]|uniref:uncharacterized protein n=1 Tax=Berkeleyomyces rouxiae TaxID=2035830 RepID=UPI003B815817